MSGRRFGRPLVGLAASALLLAGIMSAGGARAQDDGSPLIDAEVEATVVVTGGDAQGGNATGGDAGLIASITDSGPAAVAQQADLLQGGTAVGGDARGGDGLNAYIDAEVVLDADVGLDVAADVNVDTVAGASLDLSDVPVNGVLDQSAAQTLPDGLAGSLDDLDDLRTPELGGGLPNADTSALGELPSADLGGALGGLAGLNLLDLVAVLDVEVAGGDATGGNATGGSALLQATIDGASGGSSKSYEAAVTVHQVADEVIGGDATGGQAIGGDGIELDLLLDADIDLVVDAHVDLAADVDTFIEGDVDVGGEGQAAQLARFESE